jgi:hypothetical protein
VSTNIRFDSDDRKFYAGGLTLKDFDRYRVVWEGSAPVTTSTDYYGVRQYIKIVGVNTPNYYWQPAYYRTGKVYGPGSYSWYNTYDGRRFSATEPNVFNVSKDARHRNVVFELYFGSVTYGTPLTTYWLKNFNGDNQTFKNNFKIAYYSGSDYNNSTFNTHTDVVYIDIKDFEFFIFNPENDSNVGLNAIRITLDPGYQNDPGKAKYFYISPEIRYTDDKTTFGDPSNFLNGCFKAYNAGTF